MGPTTQLLKLFCIASYEKYWVYTDTNLEFYATLTIILALYTDIKNFISMSII
jgi:hypothetical protein